ncbi:MAG: response regulator transcription factor [Candidatus Omnitrophica bacterium]|nr:response regulator transcription factor [Candidatus Omnitrophota bacterium]
MISILVVDDEPLAREDLIRLISSETDFKVMDIASNGREALEKLKKINIDAVFLDIEMPVMNGLETASALASWDNPPRVVFATAYHQYAVEAFEANAIDYILKPYEPGRLKKTLERVRAFCKDSDSGKGNLAALEEDLVRKRIIKKVIGHKKKSKDRIVLDPSEVYYFKVVYSEVLARLASGELIVNSTLKDLLEILDAKHFSQTHKSYLVNLDKVQKVSPMFSGNFEITFKDPAIEKIPLSRRYGRHIKEQLGHW